MRYHSQIAQAYKSGSIKIRLIIPIFYVRQYVNLEATVMEMQQLTLIIVEIVHDYFMNFSTSHTNWHLIISQYQLLISRKSSTQKHFKTLSLLSELESSSSLNVSKKYQLRLSSPTFLPSLHIQTPISINRGCYQSVKSSVQSHVYSCSNIEAAQQHWRMQCTLYYTVQEVAPPYSCFFPLVISL